VEPLFPAFTSTKIQEIDNTMEYVPLGNTGTKVSRICLGCMSYGSSKWREWVLDEAESIPFFRQAIDAGINFFDTADMYSGGASEEVTGRALKKLGVRREHVVIATKVYNPMGDTPNERGTSKKHIRHAIEASLSRETWGRVYTLHNCGLAHPSANRVQNILFVQRLNQD